MNMRFVSVGVCLLAVSVIAARSAEHTSTLASSCAADSSFQRLSFWVGDWDVFDSTGARYATQRVKAVLDECAIVAEWTGSRGDKGIGLSAFDPTTKEWKQVYTSNQFPAPSSIKLRKSDPSYGGPGIRFVPLVDPATDTMVWTRVSIVPASGRRVLQVFEDSHDAGRSWHIAFKAEHRLQ